MSIKMSKYTGIGPYNGFVNAIKFTSASDSEADVLKLVVNNDIVWVQPHNLRLVYSGGISYVAIRRVIKTDPGAPNFWVEHVGTVDPSPSKSDVQIFHGETIEIMPYVKPGYKLFGTWPLTITVIGNSEVSVKAVLNTEQLVAPTIISGGIWDQTDTIDRLFTIYTKISNPNNVAVGAVQKLYNIKTGFTNDSLAERYDVVSTSVAANETEATITFEDSYDSYGFQQWSDPNISADNGALIAVQFIDHNPTDATTYLKSPWKFWSNKYNMDIVNNANNKLLTPGISAKYYAGDLAEDGSCTVWVNVTPVSNWPFPVKTFLETPSGTMQLSTSQVSINVASLNSVIKAWCVDDSGFELENSDIVSFNLADSVVESSSSSEA